MWFTKLLNVLPLSGYKTYLGGLGMIVAGVWLIGLGDTPHGLAFIGSGLAAIGLKHSDEKASA